MIILTERQIILLHRQLIEETGGIDGLRDIGLLQSALAAPFQSYDKLDMYPSIQQKGARLGYGLIMNHPFIDGNKRIGAHAMLVFLELNHIELNYTQEELIDIIMKTAAGQCTFNELLSWVLNHQK